jgi:general secretion pathway protein I
MSGGRGFTLIEVVVALAIVAIALAAASRAASLTLDSADEARLRVLAGLAVENHAADLRLARRANADGQRTAEAQQGNARFVLTETVSATPNALIKRVDVAAASASEPGRALATVTLYLPVTYAR